MVRTDGLTKIVATGVYPELEALYDQLGILGAVAWDVQSFRDLYALEGVEASDQAIYEFAKQYGTKTQENAAKAATQYVRQMIRSQLKGRERKNQVSQEVASAEV